MPLGKSPILQNDLMAEGDNQKFLLFNDALVKLEDSVNRALTVDMSGGDVSLTETQLLHNAVFVCTGNTSAATLTIPVSVGAPPTATNRQISVVNNGTADLTITHNNAGDEVVVSASTTAVVYGDGTDVISLGGGAAGASTVSVSDDGTQVLSVVTDINFAGTGVSVADDLDGTVTVTINSSYDGASIKAAYEGEADTNAYTDAEKAKLAALEGSKFKGTYTTDTALTAAHATAEAGAYAYVDAGTSSDITLFIFDVDDATWIASGSSGSSETSASIKSKYEANADTNAFTDADETKLDGIEAGATADQTGAELVTSIDSELGSTDWQSAGGGGGISDAPSDGSKYARKDGGWAVIGEITSRYWRVNFTGGGRVEMAEIAFRGADGVKIPGTLTQSSTAAGGDAAFANDDNLGTRSRMATADSGRWMSIDFGAGNDANVAAVAITAATTNFPTLTWDFEYSDDNSTWTSLGSIDDTASGAYTTNEVRVYDVSEFSNTETAGGAIAIDDEGTEVTAAAARLNFVGSGVAVTSSGGDATVTINGGGGALTFQGARTLLTTTTVVPSSTDTIISWDGTAFSEGTWYSAGTPTRITVPAGVTYVEAVAGTRAQAAENASDDYIIRIKKNGVDAVVMVLDNQFWGPPPVSTGAIAVSEGDYFELELWSTANWDLDETVTFLSVAALATAATGAYVEAPEDGTTYGRKDGAWEAVGSGGGDIAVSDEGVEVIAAATGLNFVGEGVKVTDVGGVATVTISDPITSVYAPFDSDDLTNVQAVFGGGMILRNSEYSGPAIRVANNTNLEETDVEFDSNGRVSGARPYGDDTRLITVYDQWGSDDFTALKAVGITLVEEDESAGMYTWQIDFGTASDGLYTTSTGADNPAWEQANPLWAFGHQRVTNGGLLNLHGVAAANNFMAVGVWQEGADLHWRIDGSNQVDWDLTDWVAHAPASQEFARAIGDMTQRSGTAVGYFNGASASSHGYANPNDNYADASRYGWGDADFSIGTPSNILSTELHIFGSTGAATASEITYIDDALAEVQTITEFAAAGGGASSIEDLDGIEANRSLLTVEHNGQPLVWDFAAQAFVASPPGFDTLRLGGGTEIIYSVADLSAAPFSNVVLDEGTYNLDQYDEILVLLEEANTTVSVELSADGGTTPDNLNFYAHGAGGTSSGLLTRAKVGGDTDARTGTTGTARVVGFSMAGFPTTVEGQGTSTQDVNDAWSYSYVADNTSRHNAISLYMTGGGSATSGRLYVLGIKKSRQPLEFWAKRTTSWTAGTVLSETPTQGAKFRAGTVGTVVVDAAPGADTIFDVKDIAGTTVATATILAAETEADFIAATDATVTDEVRIIATDAAGSATTARIAIRGELA